MKRKDVRKQEIQVIVEEAEKAVLEGKTINTCPYKGCDEFQWKNAFNRKKNSLEISKKYDLHMKLLMAETFEDIKEYLLLKEEEEELK